MDVIIVCHTEFGAIKNREIVYDKSVKEGVTVGVPGLMKVAGRYGAKVTFAVMPEAAGHFQRVWQEPVSSTHEVGLHVHPGWEPFNMRGDRHFIGDAYLREHCRMSSVSSVLRDYPYAEQLDMIKAGKEHIAETLGVEPKTFVAGRWSVNDDTVKALVKTGFTHECSASPHKKPRHYDWSKLPRICMPYRPSASDYQEKGDLPLLMVPVSQTLAGASVGLEIMPVLGRKWLESCFMEYYSQGLPLFHICLHSPCMTDPYYIGQMDALLGFIAKHNVSFKRASEVEEYAGVKPRASVLPYVFCLDGSVARACAGWLLHGPPHRAVSDAGRR
jgi:peptidoglycan/xylan/chitin deacetylase (PgdA/CDA1 family)